MAKNYEEESAFPIPNLSESDGMSLRDYFAAKALCGLASKQVSYGTDIDSDKEIAAAAYKLANAMMEEREK